MDVAEKSNLHTRPVPISSRAKACLLAILVIATLLRLRGIGFGLPALYDPDEPIFLLTALKLLRDGTLNPGWFGHPGTTTIYSLALVELSVLGAGLASGRFADPQGFAAAIYADPGVAVLPGRMFILLCGVATVALSFTLARRLFGTRAGLLAAAVLAISPVHITYSQIVRTDMHETVFLVLCVLASVGIVRRGHTADYLRAALWLGLACATKWPAVTVAVAILGAGGYRIACDPDHRRRRLVQLLAVGPASLIALIAASPFLLLDWPTVLANLTAEARPHHLGSTGTGFWPNLWWYASHPLRDAFGAGGIVLALIGMVVGSRRSRAFAVTVVPVMIVSVAAISVQALRWDRWIVPLLPFAAIALAAAVDAGLAYLHGWRRTASATAILAGLGIPLIVSGNAAATERQNDTRALASAWTRAHVPPGSRIIVETLAFDLLGDDWRFLFPVGNAGCVDVARALQARIPYTTVERWRGGRPVINLGTIAPGTFPTCRADYAIIVFYDRYLAESTTYTAELRTYEALLAQGRVVARFAPVRSRVGGPVVRIVRLDPHSAGWRPLPAR